MLYTLNLYNVTCHIYSIKKYIVKKKNFIVQGKKGWRGGDEFQTSLRDRFDLMTPLDGDSRTGVRKKEDMFRAYQPHF